MLSLPRLALKVLTLSPLIKDMHMGRFTLLNSLQKPVRNSIPSGPRKVMDSQKAGIPEAGD